jgi:hypothetical protein
MQKRSDPGRRWTELAGAVWLLLAMYLGVSWYLVAHYQPKVVLEREGPAALENFSSTFVGNVYGALAPIWQYNRLLVPTLLVLAAGLSVLAWSQLRRSRGVAA